jgi:hypothetical protein
VGAAARSGCATGLLRQADTNAFASFYTAVIDGLRALLVLPICAFAGPRRTPTITGGQAGLRAAGDEQRRNGSLTAVIRALKRRNAGSVSRVHIRAAVKKSLGDLRVPAPGRHVERGALFGVASFIHPRSCSNQCADNVAAARHGAFVRYEVQRRVSAYVGVGAQAKQQLDHSQILLRRRVVKKGSAVPVSDTSQCRIGQ